ncbi:MAG: ABC transporter permease [Panacibacter sp.]
MLKNYFKTAWRNLVKHRLFSFINIFGLATGMTVCMLAVIKIKDAYDYDNFHPDSNRSYRVITNFKEKNGDHLLYASSPLRLSEYLRKNNNDFIEHSTTVYFSNDEVEANDKKLPAKEAWVDPGFYSMFGFKLLSGTIAIQPQTVVLTSETATLFFGKLDPVGKLISLGKAGNFIVTGILAKPPSPSHLKFDMLISMSSISVFNNKIPDDWSSQTLSYTYVQLKKNVSEESLKRILQNTSQHVNAMLSASTNTILEFEIQPLNKISPGSIPLHNLTEEPIVPNLVIFALIGIAMLLLAFFNYVNLTLSRSLDRAREVGIRKVAGALKHQVIMQFLSESVMISAFAFCLAYFQLRLISRLPIVENMIGNVQQDATLWIYFILFMVVTGLLAGWIPAMVFSAYRPVDILKGKINSKVFGGWRLRKILTIIQFAASLIAIVILSVFYRQSIYMATSNYGFSANRILTLELPQHTYNRTAVSFSAIPGVETVAGASAMFGFSGGETRYMKRERTGDSIAGHYFSVSPSFVNEMKLQLVAGENLPDDTTDNSQRSVIVNEETCRELKFIDPSAAVGHDVWIDDSTRFIIGGVVKDFHYAGFLSSIQPLLLCNQPDEFRVLSIKAVKGGEQNIIANMGHVWKRIYPHQPFKANWYEKDLYDQHLHKDDLMFLGLLTFMAISIACLGLLGIVIYTTRNRSKEMSIRKIMGASLTQIVVEISKGFIGLLVISICIGLPIGIVAGSQFLDQYAYRISLGFSIIGGSVGLMLLLGGLTIGLQTYTTAKANPVKNLRTE